MQASLKRLQVPSVGLYMIHWPGFAIQSLANDAFVEGLAKVKQAGLAQAVGVSNFREDRLRRAHKILQVGSMCRKNGPGTGFLYFWGTRGPHFYCSCPVATERPDGMTFSAGRSQSQKCLCKFLRQHGGTEASSLLLCNLENLL